MPLELSDFPEEVQVAFFMMSLLPDRYEGMSGVYLGKYWDGIDYLFQLYEVDNPKIIMYIRKLYESILVSEKIDKAERKRKQAEKQATASGGKQFTHNVTG